MNTDNLLTYESDLYTREFLKLNLKLSNRKLDQIIKILKNHNNPRHLRSIFCRAKQKIYFFKKASQPWAVSSTELPERVIMFTPLALSVICPITVKSGWPFTLS